MLNAGTILAISDAGADSKVFLLGLMLRRLAALVTPSLLPPRGTAWAGLVHLVESRYAVAMLNSRVSSLFLCLHLLGWFSKWSDFQLIGSQGFGSRQSQGLFLLLPRSDRRVFPSSCLIGTTGSSTEVKRPEHVAPVKYNAESCASLSKPSV